MYSKFSGPEENDHLVDLGVDGKVMTLVLKNGMAGCGLD
jgi:hypothetical protein